MQTRRLFLGNETAHAEGARIESVDIRPTTPTQPQKGPRRESSFRVTPKASDAALALPGKLQDLSGHFMWQAPRKILQRDLVPTHEREDRWGNFEYVLKTMRPADDGVTATLPPPPEALSSAAKKRSPPKRKRGEYGDNEKSGKGANISKDKRTKKFLEIIEPMVNKLICDENFREFGDEVTGAARHFFVSGGDSEAPEAKVSFDPYLDDSYVAMAFAQVEDADGLKNAFQKALGDTTPEFHNSLDLGTSMGAFGNVLTSTGAAMA